MSSIPEHEDCREELQRVRDELETKTAALETTLSSVSLLYQITNTLTSIKNAPALYATLLEQLGKRFGAEIGIVYGIDRVTSQYEAIFALGIQESERKRLSGMLSATLIESVSTLNKIHRSYGREESAALVHDVLLHYHPKALLTAPIETKEDTPTVLQFLRSGDEEFTFDDERMLGIVLTKAASTLDAIAIQQKFKTKTDELARMNSLMINRELRMIELKKELKRLKDEGDCAPTKTS
jgi:transcriptional regulator with GAF, ATPase, and Fis domain